MLLCNTKRILDNDALFVSVLKLGYERTNISKTLMVEYWICYIEHDACVYSQ